MNHFDLWVIASDRNKDVRNWKEKSTLVVIARIMKKDPAITRILL